MSHLSLPGLYMSSDPHLSANTDNRPSILRLFLFLVAPLSLLPPLMYVYAQLKHPGAILPMLEPAITLSEALVVGVGFFLAELLAVSLMAAYISDLGEAAGMKPDPADAYAFAATAPVPLWFASLGMALPSIALNVVFFGIAWMASVAIIRGEVQTLFGNDDPRLLQRLSITLTAMGVLTWGGLMLFLALLMSMVLGLR